MKSTSAVILLLCLVAVFQSCHSIKCYKCKSSENEGCSILTNNSTYSIDCPPNFQCSAQLYSKGNNYFTTRSCEPEGASHHFELCNKSRCDIQSEENTIFQRDQTLKCCNCTSSYAINMTRPNPKCEEIYDTKYLVNCKPGEVCGKYEALNSNGSIYILERRCAPANWKFESQILCYNDHCNNIKMPMVKNECSLKYINKLMLMLIILSTTIS